MMKSHSCRNALRKAFQNRFQLFIALSVLFHICLFGGTFLLSHVLTPPPASTISVDFLSAEDLQKMLDAQRKNDPNMKQIVEQDEKNANEVAPDKAKFLSAKNQTVKKETMAVNKGDFQNTKNRSLSAGSRAAKAGGATEQRQIVRQNKETQRPNKAPSVKDLFGGYDAATSFERQQKAQVQAQQKGESGTEDSQQGSGSVSQTNDYSKDVDKGMETLLNTREFKYYSYYNRIRRQLAQHWEGKVREKLSKFYREHRAPASLNEDRITKVIVILNSAGTLVKVQIMSDSGIRDLDDAAIEAFRAAAPFPNPPKGIIESDGTVKIRWDFVLET
jgi:protein TonB